jgi:hypothetical protein
MYVAVAVSDAHAHMYVAVSDAHVQLIAVYLMSTLTSCTCVKIPGFPPRFAESLGSRLHKTSTLEITIANRRPYEVYTRNFGRGKPWLPGYLLRNSGPLSFMVKLHDGRVIRRHQNHLRSRTTEELDLPHSDSSSSEDDFVYAPFPSPEDSPTSQSTNDLGYQEGQGSTRRYPTREHRPPDRYQST